MRIVFFGTPELAVPSLDRVASKHEVTALVCQPDRPQGRSKKIIPPPTKQRAQQLGIPVHQPTKLNDGAFESWLREHAPEACVLVAYGRILKQPILDVPPNGFLNVHPSLLPRYRGPSPIQAAILNGDLKTGVSIMRLDAGTDTGDVLLQETLPIEMQDTTASMSEKVAELGARLIIEALSLVESDNADFTPQDEAQASHCHMLKKADGKISWAESADTIHNLVRAAIPWPVAQCTLHGEPLRILETSPSTELVSEAPGTIVDLTAANLVVATGAGTLAIAQVQAPGKRAMSVSEFQRGRPIAAGDSLGDG